MWQGYLQRQKSSKTPHEKKLRIKPMGNQHLRQLEKFKDGEPKKKKKQPK